MVLMIVAAYTLPSSAETLDPSIINSKSPFIIVNVDTDPNFSFLKNEVISATIHKGLPSKFRDTEDFEIASNKPHFQKGDDYFYEAGKKIDANFVSHIKEVLQTKNAVRGYPKIGLRPVKFCGGFHADYMVTLKNKSQKIDIQICYGCEDIKIFLDDVYIDEYSFSTKYAFKKWTDPYNVLGTN